MLRPRVSRADNMAGLGYLQTHPGDIQGTSKDSKIALSAISTIFAKTKSFNASSTCLASSMRASKPEFLQLRWQWSQEREKRLSNTTGLLPLQKLPSQMIRIDPFQSSRRLPILPKWSQLRLVQQGASILRSTRTTPIGPSTALMNPPPMKKSSEITKFLIAWGLHLFTLSIPKMFGLRKVKATNLANPLASASASPSP